MLMVILEFNTPYQYFPDIGKLIFLSIITLLMILILLNWKNLTVDIFAFVLYITIGAIFPFFNVYEGKTIAYIKLYFVILPLSLILMSSYLSDDRESASRLLIKFSNIVMVIAIISLFFWLFGSVLGFVDSTAIIPNSWGHDKFIATYFGIYFETQEIVAISGAESMIRNSGIFNEAPVYNMILCTALSIELFLRSRICIKRITLLTITILTTISTTGGVFLFFVYAIKGYNRLASKYKLQMILLIPILLFIGYFVINGILDNKKETGEVSYNSRSNDIKKCIEVGIEKPITGVGIFFKSEEYSTDSRSFGYSNSLFGTFAHGGFYFLILYLLPLFAIPVFVFLKNRDFQFLMMLLSFFLLFSFTATQYKVLTIIMLSYSLSYWYIATFEKGKNSITNGKIRQTQFSIQHFA